MAYLTELERAMIDENTWATNIDPTTPEALTPQMLNGHLLYNVRSYEEKGWEDEDLWEIFTISFAGWTKDMFWKATPDLVMKLREHLRCHGVFIMKDGKSIAGNMAIAANSEEYHEWTDAEVAPMLKPGSKPFKSNYNPWYYQHKQAQAQSQPFYNSKPQIKANTTTPSPYPPTNIPPWNTSPTNAFPANPSPADVLPVNNPAASNSSSRLLTDLTKQAQSQSQPPYNFKAQIIANTTTPSPYPPTNIPLWNTSPTNAPPANPFPADVLPINNPPNISPANVPPVNNPTASNFSSRLLTDLTKLYNEDKKFGAELYDIFDSKFKIFHDDCMKIGLPDYSWGKAFSTMLKGRAAEYYYDHIAGHDYAFDVMIHMMREHFHTEENHHLYLSEWRETTSLQLIAENPGKSRLGILQMLFDGLQKIQRGLSIIYQSDSCLRDRMLYWNG